MPNNHLTDKATPHLQGAFQLINVPTGRVTHLHVLCAGIIIFKNRVDSVPRSDTTLGLRPNQLKIVWLHNNYFHFVISKITVVAAASLACSSDSTDFAWPCTIWAAIWFVTARPNISSEHTDAARSSRPQNQPMGSALTFTKSMSPQLGSISVAMLNWSSAAMHNSHVKFESRVANYA